MTETTATWGTLKTHGVKVGDRLVYRGGIRKAADIPGVLVEVVKAPGGWRLVEVATGEGVTSGGWATRIWAEPVDAVMDVDGPTELDQAVSTPVERIAHAAEVAGHDSTLSTLTRRLSITAPDGSWLYVEYDRAGRLTGAITRCGDQPAASLEARVLAWVEEHRPAPAAEHKCPNYSIGVPPRCPDCGTPTPLERLATPAADPLSDAALIGLAEATELPEEIGQATYTQRVGAIADTLIYQVEAERLERTALLQRASYLVGREVMLHEAAELVAREALRLRVNARLAEVVPEQHAGSCGNDPGPRVAEPAPSITVDPVGSAGALEVGRWDAAEAEHVHVVTLTRPEAEALFAALSRRLGRRVV